MTDPDAFWILFIFIFFPDSGYTERYMGYPSSVGESPGYPEDSGLRTKGSSFQGKNLYFVSSVLP